MSPDQMPPPEVLAAWGAEGHRVQPITGGLINASFRLDTPERRLVLQRLSPIFGPEVNADIEAVTEVLARQGLTTPRLVRTVGDQRFVRDDQGRIWRALSYIEGHTVARVDGPGRCAAAGRLLGRFHRALWHADLALRHHRPGVHDTARHLAHLRRTVERHAPGVESAAGHPAHAEVAELGRRILEAAPRAELPPDLPPRLVHGDPKITNLLFDERGEGICLVDLDTLARMPLPLELGDALRSWCNPAGEERPGTLELPLAEAALAGYLEALGPRLSGAERQALASAAPLIALELAARFCADALEQSYFAWDPARYPSATAHNLARARSQLTLGLDALAKRPALERLVTRLWRG